jgi:hypothetical protein
MSRTITALSMLAAALIMGGGTLNAKEATLTGKVGDAMCGMKHLMADEAGCTRGCVKKGFGLRAHCQRQGLHAQNDKRESEGATGQAGRQDGGGDWRPKRRHHSSGRGSAREVTSERQGRVFVADTR